MIFDSYEEEVLMAFDSGHLVPIATKVELAQIRESACATALRQQRINIQLSAVDLLGSAGQNDVGEGTVSGFECQCVA